MLKKNYNCSLNLLNDLIGGKWKMRVLWHISIGHTNYTSMIRHMQDITPKMLSQTLRELEEKELIRREIVPGTVPVRVEYSFTEQGSLAMPGILMLNEWSMAYAREKGIAIPPNSRDLRHTF